MRKRVSDSAWAAAVFGRVVVSNRVLTVDCLGDLPSYENGFLSLGHFRVAGLCWNDVGSREIQDWYMYMGVEFFVPVTTVRHFRGPHWMLM